VFCVVFIARCTLVQSTILRSHVVCPCVSVRLSVTLVDCDHISWNSSDIISPLVSLGCSLSADPNIRGLLQGEHPEILAQIDPPPVDLSVGNIRLRTNGYRYSATVTMESLYSQPPTLFRMVPSLTTYDIPFPQNGVPYASKIGEWPYLRNG